MNEPSKSTPSEGMAAGIRQVFGIAIGSRQAEEMDREKASYARLVGPLRAPLGFFDQPAAFDAVLARPGKGGAP